MPTRTMRTPLYPLCGLSALLVASAAHAQSTTPMQGQDQQGPVVSTPAPTEPAPGSSSPVEPSKPAPAAPDFFKRQPYDIAVSGWKATIYGFAEFDAINDSTRSFGDSDNDGAIVRDTTAVADTPTTHNPGVPIYGATNGRTMFTVRNSRLGVKVAAPEIDGIKPSAVLEVDFMANPAAPSGNTLVNGGSISEASFFNNGVFRTRHAYVKLEDDIVDVIAGQTYYVFGNQAYFQPCALDFLPIPNEIFGRTAQFRLAHTFKTDPVNVELIAAAMRPPQRDSQVPEGQASLKFSFNHIKAMHTAGSGGTAADPFAIAVSGTVRRFKVDGFQTAPTASSSDTGWGVAADALIPIIPVPDAQHRANGLTLNGEFSIGSGYADQIGGLSGGASFPATVPGGGAYTPDIDGGMVTYDPSGNGVLHTINWRTFMAGIQYYLPPSGRIFLSANYTQGDSDNIIDLMGGGGTVRGKNAFKKSSYVEGNVFFDITPQVRAGVHYHMTTQTYGDGQQPRNMRWMGAMYYFF